MNIKQIVIAAIVAVLFVSLLSYISNQNFASNSSIIVTPTITTSVVPTLTPTLTPTIIPTRLPTRRPTVKPTLKPTSVPQNTSTPVPQTQPQTQPTVDNSPRCEIVAIAQNEGVPQTYNLIYSVSNNSDPNNFVTGIQWDYNGDGNWDSDLSLANGNVNYTYSSPGVYNINMKVQTNNGSTFQCSRSVGVQPH